MNNQRLNADGGELAADMTAIDEALTDILLRIHMMRQRWPRDSDSAEARLAMLMVEDAAEALQGASRKMARLRRCMVR